MPSYCWTARAAARSGHRKVILFFNILFLLENLVFVERLKIALHFTNNLE